jgi:hypothetical protein
MNCNKNTGRTRREDETLARGANVRTNNEVIAVFLLQERQDTFGRVNKYEWI